MVSEERKKIKYLGRILAVLLAVNTFYECQPVIAGEKVGWIKHLKNFWIKPPPIRIKTPPIRTKTYDSMINSQPIEKKPKIKSDLLLPSSKSSTSFIKLPISKISLAREEVRKHAKDEALKFLRSEAHEKTFESVHKVALKAARKNNPYKFSEVELNRIANNVAFSAMSTYEKEEEQEK
jgi:hypothetical protein